MHDASIKALLAGTFEMPLTACELRQRGSSKPTIHEGPGMISQAPDGSLLLRVFAGSMDFLEAFKREFNRGGSPGVLIPESEYFDFKGTDHGGFEWTSTHLSIHSSASEGGTYITAKLRRIEKQEQFGKPGATTSVWAIVPTNIELPWHVGTTSETSWTRDRFEHEMDRYGWTAQKTAEGLELRFTDQAPGPEPSFKLFLRALSILSGKAIEPLVVRTQYNGTLTTRYQARPNAALGAILLTPTLLHMPEAASAHAFLAAFMENVAGSKPCPFDNSRAIYGFWHRILRAGESDIENSSLVLSVAIEGIIKETFASENDVDETTVSQVERARPIAETAGFEPTVRQRILDSLAHQLKPTPVQVMRRLKDQGAITKVHIDAWNQLRNTSAHGALLDVDDLAFQRHLDRHHTCLALFYLLVFILIGFRGRYRDYATPEWPINAFLATTNDDGQSEVSA